MAAVEEKQAEEKLAEEKPAEEKPAEEKQAEEKQAEGKQAEGKQAEAKQAEVVLTMEEMQALEKKYDSFFIHPTVPKPAFTHEYQQLTPEVKKKTLYLMLVCHLQRTLETSDMQTARKLKDLFACITGIEDKTKLSEFYDDLDENNDMKRSNPIILACKYKKIEILEYMFDEDVNILENLTIDIGRSAITMKDRDKLGRTAFYHAIRTCNNEFINVLVSNWKGKHSALEFDEALSSSCEEVLLRRVEIPEPMKLYIAHKLIEYRYIPEDTDQTQTVNKAFNVNERIRFIESSIAKLETHWTQKMAEERFVFIINCIARNIHILKQEMKVTYREVPWEEMEFCLICFVCAYRRQNDIEIFYKATLKKRKLLNYLKQFLEILKTQEDTYLLSNDFPSAKRTEIVSEIIEKYPQLKQLYLDHRLMRNAYTLHKISFYVKVALLAQAEKRRGQLVIIRALQVVGNNLKNTLPYPKLSNSLIELFLQSVPPNTRRIIEDLGRSHAHSLSARLELEKNDGDFFTAIQEDLKLLDRTLDVVRHEKRMFILKLLLEKVANSTGVKTLQKVSEAFRCRVLNLLEKDYEIFNPNLLEVYITELHESLPVKTEFSQMIFNKIFDVIKMSKVGISEETEKSIEIGRDKAEESVGDKKIYESEGIMKTEESVGDKKSEETDENKKHEEEAEGHEQAEDSKESVTSQISEKSKRIRRGRRGRRTEDSIESDKSQTEEGSKEAEESKESDTSRKAEESKESDKSQKGEGNKETEESKESDKSQKGEGSKETEASKESDKRQKGEGSKESEKSQKGERSKETDKGQKREGSKETDKGQKGEGSKETDKSQKGEGSKKTEESKESEKSQEGEGSKETDKSQKGEGSKETVKSQKGEKSKETDKGLKPEGSKATDKGQKGEGSKESDKSQKGEGSKKTEESKESEKSQKDEMSKETDKSQKGDGGKESDKSQKGEGSKKSGKGQKGEGSKESDKSQKGEESKESDKSQKGEGSKESDKSPKGEGSKESDKSQKGEESKESDKSQKGEESKESDKSQKGEESKESDKSQKGEGSKESDKSPKGEDSKEMHESVEIVETNVDNGKDELDAPVPFHMFRFLSFFFMNNFLIEPNDLKSMKYYSKVILRTMAITLKSSALNTIMDLVRMIATDVELKKARKTIGFYIQRVINEINFLKEMLASEIEWNECLETRLEEETDCTPFYSPPLKPDETLKQRVFELRDILTEERVVNPVTRNLTAYKEDHRLQLAIEMLVLDILDLMDDSLENNSYFLDESYPLLTGKCLQNYLAHDNVIVNTLSETPDIMLYMNAKVLISHKTIEIGQRLGRHLKDNYLKYSENCGRNDYILETQQEFIKAMESGILTNIQESLDKGADPAGRNVSLWTAMHHAALGNIQSVHYAVSQRLGANAQDQDGQSPLHVAAIFGKFTIAQYLIEGLKADPNKADKFGKTPMHMAAENNCRKVIDILLRNKAKINEQDMNGMRPVHFAIKNNCVLAVKLLIENDEDFDVNEMTKLKLGPLHTCAEFGYTELLNYFLDMDGVDIDIAGDYSTRPLHLASINGHSDAVNMLISHGADVDLRDDSGCVALHYAVENGHEAIVDALLARGADVNVADRVQSNTPLHYAVIYKRTRIAEALLRNKANPNVKNVTGKTALHYAAQDGNLHIINMLIKHGARVDAEDECAGTALYYAVSNGHLDVFEVLLNNNAKVNVVCAGRTLMHEVVRFKETRCIQLLINKKCQVNLKDDCGMIALHHAAATPDNKAVITFLVDRRVPVNARDKYGFTPLHTAVMADCVENARTLIALEANVNAVTRSYETPLHLAIRRNHMEMIELLVQHKADANARAERYTPWNLAVSYGYTEIVKLLFEKGARITDDSDDIAMLYTAAMLNAYEIVSVLIAHGIDDVLDLSVGCDILASATYKGYTKVMAALLVNKKRLEARYPDQSTILHIAASRGVEVTKTVLEHNPVVNVLRVHNLTPLHVAVQNGHCEVIKVLLRAQAEINAKTADGKTCLHLAIQYGQYDAVKLLLDEQAQLNGKLEDDNRLVELAVIYNQLEVIKSLMKYRKINLKAKINGTTLLHVASRVPNLEIIKYLLQHGANIHALDSSLAKPIHIAAKAGNVHIVSHFHQIGAAINEKDVDNKTPLHYAAEDCRVNVMEYLITKGADVNDKDVAGRSCLHFAAAGRCPDGVRLLLRNFAVYDAVDISKKLPSDNTSEEIVEMLTAVKKLYEAVKEKNEANTSALVKAGASVNVKDSHDMTPLHYAALKGHDKIVDVLLQNGANPNVIGKGYMPLHHACRHSHVKTALLLLRHGAMYNAVSNNDNTPMDLARHKDIIDSLTLIDKLFMKVKDNDATLVDDLDRIKNMDTMKMVMNAQNRAKECLILCAVRSNYTCIDLLKEGSLAQQYLRGKNLLYTGHAEESLKLFEELYEKRVQILGRDNPATLDAKKHVAKAIYRLGYFHEAYKMYVEIYEKQRELLGVYDANTLNTRGLQAMALHRSGQDEEALKIYRELCPMVEEALGFDDEMSLALIFQMGISLDTMGKYADAVAIYRALYNRRVKIYGHGDPGSVSAMHNMAVLLVNQGNTEEAMEIYEEIYEIRLKRFGISHFDTLKTKHIIGGIYLQVNQYRKALQFFEEALKYQEPTLGPNHSETLITQHSIANTYVRQAKWLAAVRKIRAIIGPIKENFLSDHFIYVNGCAIMKKLEDMYVARCTSTEEIDSKMQENINNAAETGNVTTMEEMFTEGLDVNGQDDEGKTPLFYSAANDHAHAVEYLIKSGADIRITCNKGYTPFHIAAYKGSVSVVDYILRVTERESLNTFINAKTSAEGNTPLHCAARAGCYSIVNSLLCHGAVYNFKNDKGKTPLQIARNRTVIELLKLLDGIFNDAKNGNDEMVRKVADLRQLKPDMFTAVTMARNTDGQTIVQIAMFKRMDMAKDLLALMK